MDKILANRTFLQVTQSGSFSAAAVELGLSVASVARHVSALEEDLKVQLLVRTTKAMSLTEAGLHYRDRISKLLVSFDALEREVASYQQEVKGVLRLHLRRSVGHEIIVPALPRFLEAHPDITIDLTMTDSRDDLVAKGVDVAVWLGILEDSSLIARRLMHGNRKVCCSPAYADRAGIPDHPDDLLRHNCLIYKPKHQDSSWQFQKDDRISTVVVTGNLQTESAIALLNAAANGLGVAVLQDAMIQPLVSSGELVLLLPDYQVVSNEIDFAYYAVYPGSKQTSPKTRAFVNFLVGLFKAYQ